MNNTNSAYSHNGQVGYPSITDKREGGGVKQAPAFLLCVVVVNVSVHSTPCIPVAVASLSLLCPVVHMAGRTGRAGCAGVSTALVTDACRILRPLQEFVAASGGVRDHPSSARHRSLTCRHRPTSPSPCAPCVPRIKRSVFRTCAVTPFVQRSCLFANIPHGCVSPACVHVGLG
jgi:hypothetical protein